MAIGLETYGDTSRKEDVLDFITNVDYKSTPFISRIGRGVAMNTLHEWQTDTYDNAADNAVYEGSDASVVDHSAPTRANNITQIFRKTITVTDTERAVAHYGMTDPYTYQSTKKMTELARDIELAAIAGTRASGNSGVARKMAGAIAQVTTNKTARTSGTSFTEDEFNSLVGLVYGSGSDAEVDLVLTGTYLKRVIDKFSTNTTKTIPAEQFTQVQRVDVYESSFGTHEIVMERNIPAGGVLGINTSKWNMAWLRPVAVTPLSKTGSSTKSMVEGEGTLEGLAEKANFYASGYFVG